VDRHAFHITFPKDSIFLEAKESAKASVLLNCERSISAAAKRYGICHLVSSAVEGLAPEAVSVIDMQAIC